MYRLGDVVEIVNRSCIPKYTRQFITDCNGIILGNQNEKRYCMFIVKKSFFKTNNIKVTDLSLLLSLESKNKNESMFNGIFKVLHWILPKGFKKIDSIQNKCPDFSNGNIVINLIDQKNMKYQLLGHHLLVLEQEY